MPAPCATRSIASPARPSYRNLTVTCVIVWPARAQSAGLFPAGGAGPVRRHDAMTRNRRHKARIHARQQATGERYTQAARRTDHDRRPIGELLVQAAAGLHAAEATHTDAVLQAAWAGMCTIGAAAQL